MKHSNASWSLENNRLLAIAFLTGFFGDFLLQMLVKLNVGDWGLRKYFKQHGSAESLFIAGGMLTLFFIIFLGLQKLTQGLLSVNLLNAAIYGIFLDLFFRLFMPFESLRSYYQSLNYFQSAFWGAIPMMIPVFINYSVVLNYHRN